MKRIGLFILTFFATGLIAAEAPSYHILAPYVGSLNSHYENAGYKLNLDESGTMTGLYGQWIQSDIWQANGFLYYVPSANMTDVLGLHLNADAYLGSVFSGKGTVGFDTEGIKMHTAGSVKGLESLEVKNDVLTAMLRAGLTFDVPVSEMVQMMIFPYAGAMYESVSGEVSVDPSGPTPRMTFPISDRSTYAAAGLNVGARFFHFMDVQGKYLAGLKPNERLDSLSAMATIYITHSMALSYRFKKVDYLKRSNAYHLFGVAMIL